MLFQNAKVGCCVLKQERGDLVHYEFPLCPSSCPLFLYDTPPCCVREHVPSKGPSAMSMYSPIGWESRQMAPGISIVGNEVGT